MLFLRFALLMLAAACAGGAGPVEFGKEEVAKAIAERKLPPSRFRLQTEINQLGAESFQIAGVRISGGDLRGLMYGLLEAARQIRSEGRLTAVHGSPVVAVRGLRVTVGGEDLGKDGGAFQLHLAELLDEMARTRLNRLKLALNEDIILSERQWRSLRAISQAAMDRAIELALVLSPGNLPESGLNIGPGIGALAAVRSVEIGGKPASAGHAALARVVAQAGRRIVLEVPYPLVSPGLIAEVVDAGLPWQVVAPAELRTSNQQFSGGGVIWFFVAPRTGPDPRLGAAFISAGLKDLEAAGAAGFEIELPAPFENKAWAPLCRAWGERSYQARPPAPPKPAARPAPKKK